MDIDLIIPAVLIVLLVPLTYYIVKWMLQNGLNNIDFNLFFKTPPCTPEDVHKAQIIKMECTACSPPADDQVII